MEALIERIKKDGVVRQDDVLKVDSFLNHQVDVELLDKIGKEFYEYFKNSGITKILTIEASGIAIAMTTARYFKLPFVFAKKTDSQNLDREVYSESVFSYTRKMDYRIRISKNYLSAEDRVLILDDFLAQGNALVGLTDLVRQAGAKTAGIGVVIEKGFQNGGNMFRNMGYDIHSLVIVDSLTDGKIVFRGEKYGL
ncbi:xanthine phosphoribosyltransferase [Peptostreptococcaceae bacterium oral taxon 113 str. W5053]|nr:xanthine phosphoribosyltransferase [Peptostreptococcaceae bacterium oral taxon 113 str. W5053]